MEVALGIDIGTGSTKAGLVDERGRLLAVARSATARAEPRPGWSETDPADWLAGTAEATRSVLCSVEGAEVAAIGFSGQMHGVVVCGSGLDPLRPAVLWSDRRAEPDLDGLRARLGPELQARLANPVVAGMAGPSLAALSRLEPGLLGHLNKAFSGRTSTENFKEGGVVRLVVVEKTALGRFVKYARIKAVEYRPPDPSKKPVRAYWFEKAGRYVDHDGRRPSHKGWRSPIPGAPITSLFNPKRMHPVLKRIMPHNGTDYGAPMGTPVYAAFRGEVTLRGMHGASGNLVLIEHSGGIQTGYAHLSRFAKNLKVGDRVGTRQLVGYVGSTGRSTGPHLHFSAKKNGKFFDSRELKMDAVKLLPVTDRARTDPNLTRVQSCDSYVEGNGWRNAGQQR